MTDQERIEQLERDVASLKEKVEFLFRSMGMTGQETDEELRQRATIPAPAPV